MRLNAALDPIHESTERFIATVRTLSDAQIRQPSLVPPWTRGHTITHVARAGDSLCRLLAWARTGVETPQYSSMEARAAEIDAGAARPTAELVADVAAGADRFAEAVRALPEDAWQAEVRMRTGELRTPHTLVPARLRELEVHHADLAAGYGFADIPPAAARWIIDDIAAEFARRDGVPALRIEALDSDLAHDLGGPADSRTTPLIAGTQAALLAWLTGRSTGADLNIAGAEKVPAAPYWI
ncbi:maleylpyruvate isomerase family mycothiol-dependent enzyme [Streptomyces sp. NPDC018352]|uniref:maleylpyruvate isomerase family mycothiol-dependent enzyme n=1 Tax=Streptomyces sp. NPDC018352 TaxID=3157194 RepID=UPI00340547F6